MNSRFVIIVGKVFRRCLDHLDIRKTPDGVEYLCLGENEYEIINTNFITNGMVFDRLENDFIGEIDVIDEFGKKILS
jgi:hypothetical protein